MRISCSHTTINAFHCARLTTPSTARWRWTSPGSISVRPWHYFRPLPPIDGRFDTHIVLQQQDTTGTSLEAGGNVNVTDLQYDKRRIGTIGLGFDYRMEKGSGQQFDAKLSLDSTEVLSARGSYTDTLPERPLELKVELPGLPLTPVNALLTPGMAQLSGALKGKIAATGSFQNLSVDGSLAFAETAVEVGMIGTTFTLSPSPISIDNSLVRFGNFQIIAPNKKPLTIDGQINLRDFRAITADLLLTASDFQVVNVAKSRKSMVYGQAYMDLNTKVKGRLDNLFVRGDVSLLGGTEVNYVMQDSPVGGETTEPEYRYIRLVQRYHRVRTVRFDPPDEDQRAGYPGKCQRKQLCQTGRRSVGRCRKQGPVAGRG